MPLPELRSPLARAVVPVLGGIGVFALLGVVTWGIAVFISAGGAERTESLAPSMYQVGNVEPIAEEIAQDGPLLMQGLDTSAAKRNIVLNHAGANAAEGWQVYYAYPADRTAACPVKQVRGTPRFVDCDDRTIDVVDLARPTDVFPVVRDATTLSIDLRGLNDS